MAAGKNLPRFGPDGESGLAAPATMNGQMDIVVKPDRDRRSASRPRLCSRGMASRLSTGGTGRGYEAVEVEVLARNPDEVAVKGSGCWNAGGAGGAGSDERASVMKWAWIAERRLAVAASGGLWPLEGGHAVRGNRIGVGAADHERAPRRRAVFTVNGQGRTAGREFGNDHAPTIGGGMLAITCLRETGELVKPGDVVVRFSTTEAGVQAARGGGGSGGSRAAGRPSETRRARRSRKRRATPCCRRTRT